MGFEHEVNGNDLTVDVDPFAEFWRPALQLFSFLVTDRGYSTPSATIFSREMVLSYPGPEISVVLHYEPLLLPAVRFDRQTKNRIYSEHFDNYIHPDILARIQRERAAIADLPIEKRIQIYDSREIDKPIITVLKEYAESLHELHDDVVSDIMSRIR